MNEQIDGYANIATGFIIRLYDNPPSVWVYWPNSGKVTFYLDTPEEARRLFEALKPVKEKAD